MVMSWKANKGKLMPDHSGHELFFDENPNRYTFRLWERALAWWETIRDQVQEDYDMAMGYDPYMQEKAKMGYSGLTIPLIYVITEARTAALVEMLSRQEPFWRFKATLPHSPQSILAAEKKESAMQGLRIDLNWDAKILDLFQSCEFSNHAWWALEPEELQIGPHSNLVVEPGLFGTHKLYNTFNVLSPGQVLIDGFHQNENQIPAKFKMAFKSYWEMKRDYPDRIGTWIQEQAKSRDDSAYYNPNLRSESEQSTQDSTVMFDGSGSALGGSESNTGFLVAEAHMEAMFKDGTTRKVIYTFLPEVKKGPNNEDGHQWGYRLSEEPEGIMFPFDSVSDLVGMARSRRKPYTMDGLSTANLTAPMQREFSDQVATGRDMDREFLQPQMAVRGELLAGQEQPQWGSGEAWTFKETDWSRQMSIRDMAMQLNPTTPNRSYLMASSEKLQGLAELIGAAVEATTGGAASPNEKVGIFQARARGGASRINLVFAEHSRTLRRIGGSIMAIMAEAPEEFLYPHIRTFSASMDAPGVLRKRDLQTPSQMGIPAFDEYANREFEKMISMTIAEVVGNITGGSPEVATLLMEDILRSHLRDEQRVQQYVEGFSQHMQRQQITAAAEAESAVPPERTGSQPAQQSAMLSRAQGNNLTGV